MDLILQLGLITLELILIVVMWKIRQKRISELEYSNLYYKNRIRELTDDKVKLAEKITRNKKFLDFLIKGIQNECNKN